MIGQRMLELFEKQSPVCVCVRGLLENLMRPERLDRIFEETAQRQYCRKLAFSTCADLMSQVVARIQPSMHAAYKADCDNIPVSVTAVYDKLNGLEPAVCERLIRDTAADMASLVDELGQHGDSLLTGREVRILDGNHLAGTDHRLKELRRLGAAALPGQSVPVLDPQRKLITDVVTCEDGHASERTLIAQALELVRAGQCWMADANFCTLVFLFGIVDRNAHFIVRHHGNLHGEAVGDSTACGRTDTGRVTEQTLRITQKKSGQIVRSRDIRRITIHRDEPTRKGATEVHILSNLPKSVSGRQIALAYRGRWKIETAFQEVTTTLRCEINTLGYPDAALLGFCIALLHYNVLSVAQAALAKAHRKDIGNRRLSMYALASELSGVWRGMTIAIEPAVWSDTFESLSLPALAKKLTSIASHADIERLTTHRWSPKRPQPKRISGNRGNHVSTQKILNKRKSKAT